MRWQEDSWQPKSLMSRQPGSSLGQVPTPRGGPRSGKGSSGVRNFSYEVVADASSDMAGDDRARAPSLAPDCSRARPCPHSNLCAVAAAPGCARAAHEQAERRGPSLPRECRAAPREEAAPGHSDPPTPRLAPRWPPQLPRLPPPLPSPVSSA